MAITWGAWEMVTAYTGMRTGVEVTRTTVTNSSTNVVFTIKVYTENADNWSDTQTLEYSGTAGSGMSSTAYTNSGGDGVTLRATKTYTYTYGSTEYGTTPATKSFTATVTDTYAGITPSVSVTLSPPARPVAAPAAPTSVTTTRNSDTQFTVGWTRQATYAAPYDSLTVQRRAYQPTNGVWGWSAWGTLASALAGTSTSYVNYSTVANRLYQYRVRANNDAGSSVYVEGTYQITTPAAPSAVASALAANGTSIVTTWTNNAPNSTALTLTVERSVAGGAWASVATGLGNSAATWTDPSPGAGTNQYRVKAVTTTSLSSGYGTGNVVSTSVPPLAPTNLSPNGSNIDLSSNSIMLRWQHNPGTDLSSQSAYNIQYSTNAGSTWTTLTPGGVNSTASSHIIPAGTLANGFTYTWKVQTRGANAAFGPYSANATFLGAVSPVVTMTAPTTPVTSLPLIARWDYSQAQGKPQTEWLARLYLTDANGPLLQELSGGTARTATFSYQVTNGETYHVRVQAKSSDGVWSSTASRTVVIDLLPPVAAAITGTYHACSGSVPLSIAPSAAPGAGAVAILSADVQRSIDGGEWVTIASGLTLNAYGAAPVTLADPIPHVTGLNSYRVVTYSNSGSTATGPVLNVQGTNAAKGNQFTFLSYGPGFATVLRMSADPSLASSAGRSRGAEALLARSFPAPLIGGQRGLSVTVRGTSVYADPTGCAEAPPCGYDSTPDEWETAGLEAGIVLLRDYTGRRLFGLLGESVGVDFERPGLAAVSFSVARVDYTERAGVPVTVE